MNRYQTPIIIVQNENEQVEEQVIPITSTTGALIPNNAPPSSEQKSSNRCGWPLILGILFTMFSILVLAFLFIPRRHNPSFYNEYGFRGGLIRAITFTGITFGAMAVFVITCVVVLFIRKRKRNRTNAT